MTSRKHLRELCTIQTYNLRHSKCRFCERFKADGIVEGRAHRRPKVKPLFHARPWITQCLRRQSNNYWDRFTVVIANMAEEVEEMRTRFEVVRREPRRIREYVRLLYTESERHFELMDTHTTERRYS